MVGLTMEECSERKQGGFGAARNECRYIFELGGIVIRDTNFEKRRKEKHLCIDRERDREP